VPRSRFPNALCGIYPNLMSLCAPVANAGDHFILAIEKASSTVLKRPLERDFRRYIVFGSDRASVEKIHAPLSVRHVAVRENSTSGG
jgi:hypothetical protein